MFAIHSNCSSAPPVAQIALDFESIALASNDAKLENLSGRYQVYAAVARGMQHTGGILGETELN
jgi:hypothetical protein